MTEHETVIVAGQTGRRKALMLGGVLAVALVSAAGGYFFAGGNRAAPTSDSSSRRILYWYDPMIPQERYPGPGKSSMNMDLIPKYADEADQGGVRVSPAMTQNLGVRLAAAEMRDLAPSMRVVGRVEFDERLIAEVQTRTYFESQGATNYKIKERL